MLRQLVLLICVGSSVAQSCDTCTCFNVKTVPVSTNKVCEHSPLFGQAASVVSLEANLDSMCLEFLSTPVAGNALVVTTINYDTDTYTRHEVIETPIDCGVLSGTGPSSAGVLYALDFFLGEPCNGTYVIYECVLLGSPCITDESCVTVFIVSTNKVECQECIDLGIALAQESFPHLEFYYLPRTIDDVCRTDAYSKYRLSPLD
uniref:Uncharacterized protein n=1 Tax=Homalodisca liturata TaxID=320908 RepID=A0A1B6J8C7_9HEMI